MATAGAVIASVAEEEDRTAAVVVRTSVDASLPAEVNAALEQYVRATAAGPAIVPLIPQQHAAAHPTAPLMLARTPRRTVALRMAPLTLQRRMEARRMVAVADQRVADRMVANANSQSQ